MTSDPDNRKSYWRGRTSVSGMRMRVRLFSARDVTKLAKIARKPLAHGVTPDEIATRLDRAFFGAHIYAEQARIELNPTKLTEICAAVELAGSELLRALGLPSEPRAYTQKDTLWLREMRRDPFMGSGIGARLMRAAFFTEPLPILDLGDDFANRPVSEGLQRRDTAIAAAPLTDEMVPTSIAELSYGHSLWRDSLIDLAPSANRDLKGLNDAETVLPVNWLLMTAPSGIALLIALSRLVAQQAAQEVGHKQNYQRTFRWALFRELAAIYFQSFRSAPDILDKNREPGPATKWAKGILLLASSRSERIIAINNPGYALNPEPERKRLKDQIRATARLKAPQNNLVKGWRLFLWDHPDFNSRKSR